MGSRSLEAPNASATSLKAEPQAGAFEGDPSFGFNQRLLRAGWHLCSVLLAAWRAAALQTWRNLLVHLFGAKVRTSAFYTGAHLCCGSHNYNSENFQLVASPIEIGDRAWICTEAFIGPGVKVHAGSVVGARAVLMRSTTEAWRVWTGNPAVMGRLRRSIHDCTAA